MNSSFWYSLLGHILIGALFLVSLPAIQKQQSSVDSVPIFIELKNVEISNKTNLPVKAKTEKAPERATPKPAPKKEPTKIETQAKKVETPKIEPVQKAEPLKDAAKVVEPPAPKKPEPTPKAKPKVQKAVQPPKPKPARKVKEDDGMDSLFASVEKMSKTAENKKKEPKNEVSDLISGVLSGAEKGPTQVPIGERLTVSQTDFIKSKVREKWNFDAGIEGINSMVVEMRVFLARDGSVQDVEILNQKRYSQDAGFRSVAESARRAIYRCDKDGNESPFRMLAFKYPNRYSDWQQLLLSFSPLDDGSY
ncbi:MAG: hypothetical protein J6P93_00865 [Alphaproteobacteria bacterium]|nr:hypothetical protein [Alphaproteobacteria bacterium]